MPRYNFSCKECGYVQTTILLIQEYVDKRYVCGMCNSNDLSRIFLSTYSNVDKSAEEMKDDAKADTNRIIEKIRNGDISTIADIYGEEVNKLKQH